MLSFFLLAAALTAIGCLAVLAPVLRARPAAAEGPRDIDVYRMQLAEIDADLARGTIGKEEAAEARAELGRRILRAAREPEQAARPPRATRWAVLAAVAFVPLASWGIYTQLGSPDLQDRPLSARLQGDPAGNSVEELIARAERHLQQNPQDGTGWSVIAPVYTRLGRFAEAADAWRKAIALAGEDAARLNGLAETLLAAGDEGLGEAEAALARALTLAPGDAKARFLTAVVHERKGETDRAEQVWRELAQAEPPLEPWSGLARRALGGTQAPDAAMVENMVASLAARLEAEPDDPEGWARLVRSYVVLGRKDEAARALARGLAALGKDDADQLRAFGRELGLDE